MSESISSVGTGKDYTSISNFEAGEQGAIGAGDQNVAECYGDVGGTVWAGWTFGDNDSRIIVRPASGEKHTGIPGTGANVLYFDISTEVFRLTVEDMEIVSTVINGTPGLESRGDGGFVQDILVDRCLIQRTTSNGSNGVEWGGASTNASSKFTVNNTAFFGCYRPCSGSGGAPEKMVVNFCTAVMPSAAAQIGFYRCTMTNVISMSLATITENLDSIGNYNVTYDATAPGANVLINKTDLASYFTSVVGLDASLLGTTDDGGIFGATGLAGTPVSGITTDCVGATRDVTTPDVGAFEYIAAITTPVTTNAALDDANPTRGDSTNLSADIAANGDDVESAEYYIGAVDPGEGSGTAMTLDPVSGQSVEASAVIDTTLITSGAYDVHVRGFDGTSWGATDSVEMTVVLGVPQNVTATPGDEQVTIGWDVVTGATTYKVYYSETTPVGLFPFDFQTNPPKIKTGLTNGTPYYFAVTAHDSGVASDLSAEASATPAAPPPSTPDQPGVKIGRSIGLKIGGKL